MLLATLSAICSRVITPKNPAGFHAAGTRNDQRHDRALAPHSRNDIESRRILPDDREASACQLPEGDISAGGAYCPAQADIDPKHTGNMAATRDHNVMQPPGTLRHRQEHGEGGGLIQNRHVAEHDVTRAAHQE